MPEETDKAHAVNSTVWMAVTALAAGVSLILGRDVIPPMRFLVWHAASLAWFAVIIVSAYGQGRVAIVLLDRQGEHVGPHVRTVLALGAGLGFLSLETFFLAAAGLMNTMALTALITLVFTLTAVRYRHLLPGLAEEGRSLREAARGAGLPLSLAGFAALISFPFALVPTRAFDALSYHLEVPLRYLQAGRIIDIPENLYSYTPQLNHTLYGLALGLSGSDLAGLLNHLYFILAIATLWLGFKNRFGQVGTAWAAALVALSPLMLVEAVNSGVDWSAAFYTAAVLSLLSGRVEKPGVIFLAGIMAGMAAGCRHQPLAYAMAIPAVVFILEGFLSRRKGAARNTMMFFAVAVAVASPWYIRNWVFAGDPFYPLLANLAGQTDTGSGFVSALVGEKSVSLLWKWAVLPFKMVFDPLSYSMTATAGIQYLVFLPLLLVRRWRPERNMFLLSWFVLAFLAWYLNFSAARYAMPILMVGALWVGTALAGAVRDPEGFTRSLIICVTSVLVLNAGTFIGIQDRVNRNVGAALGMVSSSRYLLENYAPYPSIEYLNNLAPPSGRVLFTGEMRGFYSLFPREVPSHNRPNRLLEMVKEGLSPGDMVTQLKKAGFTHILFNPAEYDRMANRNKNAPLWRLSETQSRQLDEFLERYTDKVFTKNGIDVFRIGTEAGSD